MDFRTADLCDQFSDELEVCEPLFKAYGGQVRFAGPLATIKCFEDNSRVRDLVAERGDGRVLVVDAGGSMRRAVLGGRPTGSTRTKTASSSRAAHCIQSTRTENHSHVPP